MLLKQHYKKATIVDATIDAVIAIKYAIAK